jgi:hypothetical protein
MFIAWRSFLYSEAPEERNRFLPPRQSFRCRVSLLTKRDHGVSSRSHKHLAPLERKRISLLHFQLESTSIDLEQES